MTEAAVTQARIYQQEQDERAEDRAGKELEALVDRFLTSAAFLQSWDGSGPLFAEQLKVKGDGHRFDAVLDAMIEKGRSVLEQVAAGVPLLPGYHGEAQDEATLTQAALDCGLGEGRPVMLKAVLGGGGKGMRVVETMDEFAAAVEGAQREAMASFNDSRLLIERYLPSARHIRERRAKKFFGSQLPD